MTIIRCLLTAAVAWSFGLGAASAQTAITVGKITGGIGLHIPSYVAMDKGFFKEEGLDARWVVLGGRPMLTAGLSGNLDFVPVPSGGAQAVLKGAKLTYVVNQSLKPQYIFVARPEIAKVEDVRGKLIALARPGAADYDEGVIVLSRFHKMEPGRDYKVISFAGEPERLLALLNGDVQVAMVSVAQAPRALHGGMKIILRTGDVLPRVGGGFWVTDEYFAKNQDTVKRFIRAIAKAVTYFRDNKAGSLATLKEHVGVENDEHAGLLWDELRDTFAAEMPADLFRELFESRRLDLISRKEWPEDKPLPDPEQFLARALLEATLKDMNYVPTKIDPKK